MEGYRGGQQTGGHSSNLENKERKTNYGQAKANYSNKGNVAKKRGNLKYALVHSACVLIATFCLIKGGILDPKEKMAKIEELKAYKDAEAVEETLKFVQSEDFDEVIEKISSKMIESFKNGENTKEIATAFESEENMAKYVLEHKDEIRKYMWQNKTFWKMYCNVDSIESFYNNEVIPEAIADAEITDWKTLAGMCAAIFAIGFVRPDVNRKKEKEEMEK